MANAGRWNVGSVEGSWGKFDFKMINQNHEEEVMEHLRRYFYLDEPMNILLGCSPQYQKDLDENYRWFFSLPQNLSFVAIDRDSGEIAGVQIIYEKSEDMDFSILTSKYKSEEMEVVWKILDSATDTSTVNRQNGDHGHDPSDHGKKAKISSTSVHPNFRGIGLATEIYRRTVQLLKQNGFTSVFSFFTSPHTRKISAELGFKEQSRIVFAHLDLRWKTSGKLIFEHVSQDHVLSHQILYLS